MYLESNQDELEALLIGITNSEYSDSTIVETSKMECGEKIHTYVKQKINQKYE